jgi:hypothetical protein
MALLSVLSQQILTPFNGDTYVISEVYYDTTGDTVDLPGVPTAAAALAASGNTAPTVATASGDVTVTLTGGTAGATVILVSRHAGANPAGLNAAGVGA